MTTLTLLMMVICYFFKCILRKQKFVFYVAVDSLKAKVTRKKGRGFGGMWLASYRGRLNLVNVVVCINWIFPSDSGTGFQGDFDAIDSDGPGPLRCMFGLPEECIHKGTYMLLFFNSCRGLDCVYLQHQRGGSGR